MMDAKKCDRCGIYFDFPRGSEEVCLKISVFEQYARGTCGEKKTFDLCPECAEQIRTWMAMPCGRVNRCPEENKKEEKKDED